MSSKFDKFTDSKFYNLGEKLGNIIILSLLWVVCSLPIVTIGASSAALYFAIHKNLSEGSEAYTKDFFHSFKANLKPGIILSVITILYCAVTAFNMYIGRNGIGNFTFPSWYFPFSFVLLIPIIFILPFLFPYVARFSDTIGKTLKNCFTFGSIQIFSSIEIVILMLAASAAFYYFPPCLLVVPYFVCRITHFLTEKSFNTVLLLMDKRAHPEKYPDPASLSSANEDDKDNEDDDEYEYIYVDDDDEDDASSEDADTDSTSDFGDKSQ